jgi:hypothetical protein
MVMGSVLWMEGVGLGLARNIVQRYALETGGEQGFGIRMFQFMVVGMGVVAISLRRPLRERKRFGVASEALPW